LNPKEEVWALNLALLSQNIKPIYF